MVSGISGSSGFDVDSTVSQLMKARRVPIDKLGQQKQILTWRRDTYKETNSKIVDFRNNKLFNFKLESTLKAKKVDLTGNTSAISAKANGNALTGTLTVLATTLATAASNMSNSDIRLNTTFDASLTLGSQAANIRNSFTQTVPGTYDKATISINGTQVVVDPNVDSLNNVIDRINKTTNVSAFYDSVTGKVSFTSKQTGLVNGSTSNQPTISFQDITGSFMANTFLTVNGSVNEKAAVNANVTINGITTTRTSNTFNVNGVDITLLQAGGAGPAASKASVTGAVPSSTNILGTDTFTFTIDGQAPITLTPGASTNATIGAMVTSLNAAITGNASLNGKVSFGVDSSGTKLVVNDLTANTGTTSTLTVVSNVATNGFGTAVSGTGQAATSPVNINVSADADKIVDAIKGFIKDYNDLLSSLQVKVNENKYRDFLPLTDDQKKAMKDNDVKTWEDKAKSGLLRNDSILKSAINNMRLDIMSKVNTGTTTYNTLSSIGITTGSYMDKGKLYLSDETKLRAAIAANPDAVFSIFAAPGTGTPDRSDMGIAQRIYNDLKITLDNISTKAGTSSFADTSLNENSILGKDLTRINSQIFNENKRLKLVEGRYYKQFTAMETAMNKYNSQSSYLANALSGGSQR